MDAIKEPGAQPKWSGPEDGLPPLGIELDGVKCVSCNGIEEWQSKPHWRVVGHHIDGETFFVQGIKSKIIQTFSINVKEGQEPQYRPIKSEREKLVEKLVEVIESINMSDKILAEALLESEELEIRLREEAE